VDYFEKILNIRSQIYKEFGFVLRVNGLASLTASHPTVGFYPLTG